MSSEKKTSLLIWASVAAAAAGITVAALLFRCKGETVHGADTDDSERRHLDQILTDCYDKLHEIEARLPSSLLEPTQSL